MADSRMVVLSACKLPSIECSPAFNAGQQATYRGNPFGDEVNRPILDALTQANEHCHPGFDRIAAAEEPPVDMKSLVKDTVSDYLKTMEADLSMHINEAVASKLQSQINEKIEALSRASDASAGLPMFRKSFWDAEADVARRQDFKEPANVSLPVPEMHSGRVLVPVLAETEGLEASIEVIREAEEDKAEKLRSSKVDMMNHSEYALSESVWDVAPFLGHREVMGVWDSIIVFACFIGNIVMQLYTCYIISGPAFTDDPFPDSRLEGLRRWRASDAHSNAYTDPARSASLVSRVCNGDPGLTLSTSQEYLYSSVYSYRESGGYFLCLVALSIFAFDCLSEFRHCINFLLAMLELPRGYATSLSFNGELFCLLRIGYFRLIVALFVVLARFGIVGCLLTLGSKWLCYTTDINDLLLNASSLSFVLSIDELVYAAFIPSRCETVLRCMQPVEIPRHVKLTHLLPTVLIAVFAGFIYFCELWYLSGVVDVMDEVEDIICGGNQNFVYGLDVFSKVTWTKTDEFGALSDKQLTLESIIRRLTSNYSDDLAWQVAHQNSHGGPLLFNKRVLIKTVDDYNREFMDGKCRDTAGRRKLGLHLWSLSGRSDFFNYSLSTCKDVVKAFPDICDEMDYDIGLGRTMRFNCPITCGCTDARSGLSYRGVERLGCKITPCRTQIRHSLSKLSCNDSSMQTLNSSTIQTKWRRLARVFSGKNGNHAKYEALLLKNGCAAISNLTKAHQESICLYTHGASSYCPKSCKCETRALSHEYNLRDVCPASCF